MDTEWLAADFADLQEQIDVQRRRRTRIRLPTFDEVRHMFRQGSGQGQPRRDNSSGDSPGLRVRWTLVGLGYQPALTRAWMFCMIFFADESKQDRVFEESLFWVITRSIDCFY
jgi:hypothetical protein